MHRLVDPKNAETKKLLIGSSLSEVDSFIKFCVSKYKRPIINIEKGTFVSLATALVQGSAAYASYSILSNNEAIALFYDFLANNINGDYIFKIIPKDSFSYETAKEAYQSMNQIRNGHVIDEKHKLVDLISIFEEYLITKQMALDESLVLKKAIEIITQKQGEALKSLGFTGNVDIFLLVSASNRMSFIETEFHKALGSLKQISLHDVVWYKYSYPECNMNPVFFKVPTFGFSNEIKYIIKEIEDKAYNLSDVAIYTPNSSYDNTIRAYFDIKGINCCFENGESISGTDFVGFINSVLDFVTNHFSIENLYSIYKNPAIGFYTDAEGKNHSYSNISKLIDLKADKSQILCTVDGWDGGKKKFITELVNIYNKNDSVKELFVKVLEFSLKYTTSLSHKYCKDALYQNIRFFEMFKAIDTYDKKVDIIKSAISSIYISKDVKNDESYVLIANNTATFLPRKYNFFIGLSSSELTLSEVESPLLADAELTAILDSEYYIKKAQNRNSEYLDDLKLLLKMQSVGTVYLITSVYDSVNFKELSKSSFYLNSPGTELSVQQLIDKVSYHETAPEAIYIYPRTAKNDSLISDLNFSPSRIEKLISCPLKYIYSMIYNEIETDTYTEKWLKGGDEGTFAHLILEKYFNDKADHRLDEERFKACFNDAFNETKNKTPFSNTHIQDLEADKVCKMVYDYLTMVDKSNDKYKTIACELTITDAVDYPDVPDVKIHGIIDRVDAFVDDSNELHIRIVDYKTYSKKSFDDHKRKKTLTQVILYPYLINFYINQNLSLIESKVKPFNKKDEYIIEFVYEILKDNSTYTPTTSEKDEIKASIDDCLHKYKNLIAEPTFKKFIEEFSPEINMKSQFDTGRCSYCPFSHYCKFKIEEGDNMTWNK